MQHIDVRIGKQHEESEEESAVNEVKLVSQGSPLSFGVYFHSGCALIFSHFVLLSLFGAPACGGSSQSRIFCRKESNASPPCSLPELLFNIDIQCTQVAVQLLRDKVWLPQDLKELEITYTHMWHRYQRC